MFVKKCTTQCRSWENQNGEDGVDMRRGGKKQKWEDDMENEGKRMAKKKKNKEKEEGRRAIEEPLWPKEMWNRVKCA